MDLRLNHFASVQSTGSSVPVRVAVGENVYTIADRAVGQLLADLYARRFVDDSAYLDVLPETADKPATRALIARGILIGAEHNPQETLDGTFYLSNPLLAPVRHTEGDILDILRWTQDAQVRPGSKISTQPPATARRSCRKFDPHHRVSDALLEEILARAYGPVWMDTEYPNVVHRPVASAGGLYPLQLNLIAAGDEGFRRGQFNKADGRILWSAEPAMKLDRLREAFLPECQALIAPGIVCCAITMDTRYVSRKYGLRSLLYGAIEAGSATQMIVLESLRLGISSCQIGGYLEQPLLKLSNAAESEILLAVVLLGYAAL